MQGIVNGKHRRSGFISYLLLIAFLIGSVSLFAENEKPKPLGKKILTDELEEAFMERLRQNPPQHNYTNPPRTESLDPGDTLFFTERDFSMNTIMGRKIAVDSEGNISTIAQVLLSPNDYNMEYNFFLNGVGNFGAIPVDATAARLRSGRVFLGPDEIAWISLHDHINNTTHMYQDAGKGFYSFSGTSIAPGRFASAAHQGNFTNWLVTNDADANFVIDNFYSSTDGGATWDLATIFDLPEPDSVTFQSVPGGVELFPHFNPANPTEATVVTTAEEDGNGTGAFGALTVARTTDLGQTWTVDDLYRKGRVVDGTLHYYLVNNFSQTASEYSSNGTLHLAFNGYGIQYADSTLQVEESNIFPIVYWNSNMGSFNEVRHLTGPEFMDGRLTNTVAAARSGNEIGCSKPGVSVSHPDNPNPNLVAVVWAQPEIVNDTSLVLAPNPDGSPSTFHGSDIWCAVSSDNGTTWSAPFYVAGAPEVVDIFPSINKHIMYNADTGQYYIHFMYMHDKVPGSSVFDGTSATPPAAWVYNNYDITAHIPVGIDDNQNVIPGEFELAQNYPNPFNPQTTIAFTLQRTQDITVEVFNITGQKIATLFKGRKSAGEHQVVFDGQNIASGVYLYRLSNGAQSLTQKMVLLK